MNFQRAGNPVMNVILNPTTPQNPPPTFQLIGIPQAAALPTITSSTTNLQVEGIRRNPQSRLVEFRLRVASILSCWIAVVTATHGGASAALNVGVDPAIELPDRNTVPGAVARLLMAEARGPSHDSYVAADSLRSMRWMRRVLENRLANNPRQFGAQGAQSLIDIIKAPNQFAGFSNYPNYDAGTRARLQEMLNIANNDSDQRQQGFREFVHNALSVAQGAAIADPCLTGLYGWRTQGAGGPGGRFVVYQSVAGNTFYTLQP
jgi:hypothetical protein